MKLEKTYKKVRFFTRPKTYFSWTGVGFQEEEQEEDEEEEDVEELQGTHDKL